MMKKLVSFVLVIALLIPMGAYANTGPADYDLFQRVSSVPEVDIGGEFELTYDVAFKSIPVSEVPLDKVVAPNKEVVLIIDTSGSMSEDVYGRSEGTDLETRMEIVQNAALAFLDTFRNDKSTKIAVVTYSSKAELNPYAGKSLICMADGLLQTNSLEDTIRNAEPTGGTNIGDALRRAKEIFDTEGTSTASKYMIILTDGIPNAFSVDSLSYNTNPNKKKSVGIYRYSNGTVMVYVDALTSAVLKKDQGDASRWFVHFGDSDIHGYALNYAKNMASEYNDSGINTMFVAFANPDAGNKLKTIAAQCNGEFFNAVTVSGLESVYAELSGQITKNIGTSVVYTNVGVSETIPTGFEFLEYDDSILISDQRFYKTVGDLVFRLNEEGTAYVADPIHFTVKLKATTPGAYLFGRGTNAGYTQYVTLAGETGCDYFGELFFIVQDEVAQEVIYDPEILRGDFGDEVTEKLDNLDFDIEINVSSEGLKKIGAPLVAYRNMLQHVNGTEVNRSLSRTNAMLEIFGEDFDLALGEGSYVLNNR
jgi:uncharacterized protein YegL